ncbi:MAG: thiolase family protein [Steroidobacteraceae bacterium]
MSDSIFIVAARRTPIGAFLGALAPLSAPELGAAACRAALADAHLEPDEIEEVILGCVLSAGLGQAPARQAAIGAGIAPSVPATTVNKMCGSGLKTVMMAADQLRTGDIEIALAGGLESMSNAPYLLPKARGGLRMGHAQLLDHMLRDGLESPFDGQLMGCFAEATARKYGFTRAAQDAYATESVTRALRALRAGEFAAETTPVTVKSRQGEKLLEQDETPGTCDVSRIRALKPAFAKDGTVTAASSSSVSDGAAALILASDGAVRRRGLEPLARIAGYATHAQQPEWFTTAPGGAIHKLLTKLGWAAREVDLYEINEAFAAVTMAALSDLDLDPARVNVQGGACALGHPIGATGARILVTLVHALRRRLAAGSRGPLRGIASLCIGGGEAVALAVETP